MDTPLPTSHPSPPRLAGRVLIPFISTSFITNVWLFTLLWPLWWVVGVDQLLLPFFVTFEFVRFLIRSQWQFRLNGLSLIALVLAIWWLVPVFWVDTQYLDIFLKEAASIWAQFFILVLFWNQIRTGREWWRIVDAVSVMALYTAAATAVFVSGLWRGEFVSAIGRLLPRSLIESSTFFSSISFRQFGIIAAPEEVGLFTLRLNALTLSFSALSMLCLLLLPLIYWRLQLARGAMRLYYLAVLGGLFLALLLTESRIAYAAFLVGVGAYILLRLHVFRPPNRPLTVAAGLAGAGLLLLAVFLLLTPILAWFRNVFVELRPGSWLVRAYIYAETIALLPEHPIAGWGMAVRLPNVASEYSAGTHSSYLGMLFQHGIIGLLSYLGLWLSVWLAVLRGLRTHPVRRHVAWFWCAMAAAFLSFNVREVADTWWWDQSLLFVAWLLWGLAITARRVFDTLNTDD